MMKHLLLAGVLIIGGCASAGAGPAAGTESNLQGSDQAQKVVMKRPKLICTNEPQVGSNFPRRVCRDARDVEMERERDRELMDSDEVSHSVPGEN